MTPNSCSNFEEKNKAGGITIPDIKLYYKDAIIKRPWYWHRNRHMGQWNRIEIPEINLSLYRQLIFNKWGRSIKWSKIACSTNDVGRSGEPYAKKMKLHHHLHHTQK